MSDILAMAEVSRLPVEVRVLRGCGWCGKHLMTEAEFLEWLKAPRDVACANDGWTRLATTLAVVQAEQRSSA